jgi:hypothetical protein
MELFIASVDVSRAPMYSRQNSESVRSYTLLAISKSLDGAIAAAVGHSSALAQTTYYDGYMTSISSGYINTDAAQVAEQLIVAPGPIIHITNVETLTHYIQYVYRIKQMKLTE